MDDSKSKEIFCVYSPPWVDWSAGIRVLHFLCDQLNEAGFEAYLALHGPKTDQDLSADLNTPVLTSAKLKSITALGRKIIAIYPESIVGNPLNAEYVVRWILNYPTLLAGSQFFEGEAVLAYSRALSVAMHYTNRPPVLFVPALKTIDFAINEETKINLQDRPLLRYELVYAQKYRTLGGKLPKLKANQIEITRFGKDAPDRTRTLHLIRGASLVHVYENSTVITEALLLGTPVICHRNEYFHELIAGEELPMTGVSWDPEHIQIPEMKQNFIILQSAESKLQANIKIIFQNIVLKESLNIGKKRISIPKRGLISKHSLSRARSVIIRKGPFVFVRFFINYISH